MVIGRARSTTQNRATCVRCRRSARTTRVLSRARRARDAGVVGRASTSSRSTARRAGARPRSCAASAVGGGKREWRGELESEHRVSATADLVGPRHPFLLRATLPAQSSSLRHTTAEPLSTVPPAAQAHRRGPAAVFVWRCTNELRAGSVWCSRPPGYL